MLGLLVVGSVTLRENMGLRARAEGEAWVLRAGGGHMNGCSGGIVTTCGYTVVQIEAHHVLSVGLLVARGPGRATANTHVQHCM